MKKLLLLALLACRSEKQQPPPAPPPQRVADATADKFAEQRARMVAETIEARGVKDPRVLEAMRRAPRHELVPEPIRHRSYEDTPLPIGFDQTISQPFIVAAMTEAAQLAPGEKVLEVGTGSGYQAIVLAELGVDIYSIEIVEPLAKRTHELLAKLGYDKLHLRIGDGYRGWPEAAPFDAIIVTAAPDQVPQPLVDQLAIGGRLVIPVGKAGDQQLKVIVKDEKGTTSETLMDVRFVPMTGEAQKR
ncbi:MAG TPA: protein-L-isoaspartate(D-aspartate) O-methyltransferase [Xanthomonadales bacterium]|nr:protein-L-isoaspartate(D-aspartate) O-methyltransferase [Xanthomonadales bacterium]